MDKEINGRSKVPLEQGRQSRLPAPSPSTCFYSLCTLGISISSFVNWG